MRNAIVQLILVSPTSPAAHQCLAAYFRELVERFEGGFDAAGGASALAREMVPPKGAFVLARIGGAVVGCGGFHSLGEGVAEIKRMWVAPRARGRGVARHMLRHLETLAREASVTTLRLDTNRVLIEARAMYLKEGYREIARYNDNPYADCWFEKKL